MSVEIRAAVSDDAVPLAPLLAAAIRATYAPFAQAAVYETVIAQTCTEEAMRSAIESAVPPDNWFLVAEDRSSVIGFLDFGRDDDGFELRRLYVDPDRKGGGTGTRLLARLEQLLPPGLQYTSLVHEANTRALSFWARHGFVKIGEIDTREHFVRHRDLSFVDASDAKPEPALLLSRTVSAP
jgi:GNAT superfamily N-acetyltransferase